MTRLVRMTQFTMQKWSYRCPPLPRAKLVPDHAGSRQASEIS